VTRQPWEAERPTAEPLSLLQGGGGGECPACPGKPTVEPPANRGQGRRPWEARASAELLRGSRSIAGSTRRRRETRSAVAASQQMGRRFGFANAIADFHAVVSILEVLGDGGLQRVAATNGGEWAGPCLLCGGKDRLRVWPSPPTDHPRAWCRQCRTSGDTLWWAIRLSGRDPTARGATASFLHEFGFLIPAAGAASQQTEPAKTDHGYCPAPDNDGNLNGDGPEQTTVPVSEEQERPASPSLASWLGGVPLEQVFHPLGADGEPPTSCRCCGGCIWWRLVGRKGSTPWVCERCHPPQVEEKRIERVDLDGGER